MMHTYKAVIPAAGLGTRLLPATKSQPKEMLPIVDRPAIQYVVEEAVNSGIEDILIITGRGKRTLEDHFDRAVELEAFLQKKEDAEALKTVMDISNSADIFFIRQKQALGLGHAVSCAKRHVGQQPFVVMLGDDIFVSDPPAMREMIDFHRENPDSIVVAVQEVSPDKVSSYGIVDVAKDEGKFVGIRDLVEKPLPSESPSNLAIVGRYVLPPAIFEVLEETLPDAKGEIQLTDAIKAMKGATPVYGFRFGGKRYDIGGKLSYLTTNVAMALERSDLKVEFREFLQGILRDS